MKRSDAFSIPRGFFSGAGGNPFPSPISLGSSPRHHPSKNHRIARTVWIILLSAALVACAETPSIEQNAATVTSDPLATMCLQLPGFVSEFTDVIDHSDTFDPRVMVDQSRFAASNIYSVIEIAKRQGLNVNSPKLQWAKWAQTSAEAYVYLNDTGYEGYTDQEGLEALTRIYHAFKEASSNCQDVTA
jgi:hypothetical protein